MHLQIIKQPGYYDLNYQTPTSLGASGVRDGNLGSVAYSTMSDGRFARTDNNSSPVSNVPSTMSQQTGSGGPQMQLNLPYAYFYGANMMPGSFQYGTPALYQQQLNTNAPNAQFATLRGKCVHLSRALIFENRNAIRKQFIFLFVIDFRR